MSDLRLDFEPSKRHSTKGTLIVFGSDDKPLHSDTLNIASSKGRERFVNEVTGICEAISTEQLEQAILDKVGQIAEDRRKSDGKAEDDEAEPLAKSRTVLNETDPELVKLAEQRLRSPDLIGKMIAHARILGVAGETDLVVAVYIIGTSRLLKKPLAGLVMGPSSVGKSFVTGMVAKLIPDEAVLMAHQISPKALQYLPPGSLIHRFVVAGERSLLRDDTAAEATRALREMISDGMLSSLVSAAQTSGPHQTVHVQQKGPIAYIESTTLGVRDIFDEDRTRFIILCSDERIEQSRAIVERMAASVSKVHDPDRADSTIALHHTAQRLLQSIGVVIPFANKLRDCLPIERIEVRRTFGHLISLIQAVALLHQFQRERNQNGQIIATLDDYDVVRQYLVPVKK